MFQLRLKELRESCGYSQYSFANKFGIAQSTVGNWEAGKRQPDFATLQKLADFFGVSTDYLLGRTDEAENKKTPVGKTEVSDEDIKFALFGDASDEITDDDFEDVKRYAQFLKEKKKK